ncbi:MAG: hypothetical protein HW380_4 [Magnetococcales bacterium]|nr:hypothetical protein [Magnetococcales bacterium]HIJ85045.1 hypothetical protein [Magnetococcales bacterium]
MGVNGMDGTASLTFGNVPVNILYSTVRNNEEKYLDFFLPILHQEMGLAIRFFDFHFFH